MRDRSEFELGNEKTMHNEPREHLCRLIQQYGEEIIADPRRCMAYLMDYCGSYGREIKVLGLAQQEGVVEDLQAADPNLPFQLTRARLAQRLVDTLALSEEAAGWAVESWALAVGIDPARIHDREFSSTLKLLFWSKSRLAPDTRWAEIGATPGTVTIPPDHMVTLIPDVKCDEEIAQLAQETRAAKLTDAVKELSLFYAMEVTDRGVAQLQTFSDLTHLNLTHTQISDAGMAYLPSWPRLQRLTLSLCHITDAGMLSLRALQQLKYLSLFGCRQISDTGFANLRDLVSLAELDLGETQISDVGIKSLRTLEQLAGLNLHNCEHLTEHALGHLTHFKHLRRLNLSGTHITGQGLKALPPFEEMAQLDLSHTQITDVELPLLRIFPHLTSLDLSGTRVTDKGLDYLRNFNTLTELSLYGARFRITDLKKARRLADLREVVKLNRPTPKSKADKPKT
ncbi:MAG: hypothetical protein JXA21_13225 [Anaerolineae bacterium]|nr:hypothetical protein [Anaerolineae bacterium]